MKKLLDVTPAQLDDLYATAVAAAGPFPNALGFMQRVYGSAHYREPPVTLGQYDSGYKATAREINTAASCYRLTARVRRW